MGEAVDATYRRRSAVTGAETSEYSDLAMAPFLTHVGSAAIYSPLQASMRSSNTHRSILGASRFHPHGMPDQERAQPDSSLQSHHLPDSAKTSTAKPESIPKTSHDAALLGQQHSNAAAAAAAASDIAPSLSRTGSIGALEQRAGAASRRLDLHYVAAAYQLAAATDVALDASSAATVQSRGRGLSTQHGYGGHMKSSASEPWMDKHSMKLESGPPEMFGDAVTQVGVSARTGNLGRADKHEISTSLQGARLQSGMTQYMEEASAPQDGADKGMRGVPPAKPSSLYSHMLAAPGLLGHASIPVKASSHALVFPQALHEIPLRPIHVVYQRSRLHAVRESACLLKAFFSYAGGAAP